MKEEWRNVISHYLGVQPILINSKLVSAQSRPRWYWTNIPGVLMQPGEFVINSSDKEKGTALLNQLQCDHWKAYKVSGLNGNCDVRCVPCGKTVSALDRIT